MISILIPVYNTNVADLVDHLREQALKLDIPFEIVVLDDASDNGFKSQNNIISAWNRVRYVSEEKNQGRSVSRNKLAHLARYSYLLFIDGDAAVTHEDFLREYCRHCEGEVIVCGGTSYDTKPPENREFFFRWKYGLSRESVPAKKRCKSPNAGFSSFNFLIEKKLFLTVKFDEKLKKYGHEDTLFGYNLQQKGLQVAHIDNPLLHQGLESGREFKRKTVDGLKNLYHLTLQMQESKDFIRQVRILRTFYRLKKLHILPFPCWLSDRLLHLADKKTDLPNPGLAVFDIYKLLYFSSLYKS